MEVIKNKTFLAIFFLGAILRLLFVEQQSLWMDEASVYYESFGQAISDTWARRHSLQPQNAPILPLFVSWATQAFEVKSFLSFRYFSVFLGILSLFVIYKFGKEYFGNNRQSHLLLMLVAISSFHIQFSQLIRFYILLFTLFYLHLYLSLRWFKSKSNITLIFIFLIAMLGCWTNQLMALSFFISSLLFIVRYGFSFKRLVIFNAVNVLGFATYLPSYLLYINGSFKIGSFRNIGIGDFGYMLKSIMLPKHIGPSLLELRFLQQNQFNLEIFYDFLNVRLGFEFILLLTFFIVWVCVFKNIKKLGKESFVFIFAILFFTSYLFFKKVPLNARYFLIFTPLMMVILIQGLELFARYKNRLIVLVVIINLYSSLNYFFDSRHHTLNTKKIFTLLSPKNNYVSLDSSRFYMRYFRKNFINKKINIVENLVDRSLYDQYLPEYFGKLDNFTFIFTYRSILKLKNLDLLFDHLKKTHSKIELHQGVDPYFRMFKFERFK